MAISLVGASIIWKFVYDYRATDKEQIGLANEMLKLVGLDTYRFLFTEPWNTIFLIVMVISVQAGFAMTILSASIKAIPDDIVEAARLDGVGGLKMFRYITIPSIRPSLIVVLTTSQPHHPEGLRHRPHDHRRQLRHQRARLRVLRAELPVLQPGSRRRPGRADLRAGHADRHLQRASTEEVGGPMSTANPDQMSVESVVAKETAASTAHKALTNPWASLAAVLIAIFWTIPTIGLLITSFRPEADVTADGWWNVFIDPSLTLDNYKTVINGTDGSTA